VTAVWSGVVAAFDDHRGYGSISRSGDGTELFFHCTALADGSRTVEVGRRVRFTVAAGHLGRFEARAVEKV
jgi:cold shock CspA family protein